MEKSLPRICSIEAPGKINLHLRIGEKQPDGYHALESIFVPLALGDTLRFERTEKGDCHLLTNWEVPEETILPTENLVVRAVSLFRERTGFNPGLRIRLDKRIPTGAGLGGGSSDAASTLLAMNLLSGSALSLKELREMAVLLGSDVPFFLSGGAAFVSGRGEITEAVNTPQGLWVVLVKPPFSSDTAKAYSLLDQARKRGELSGKTFSKKEPAKQKLPKEALIRALEEDPCTWPFHNDFLAVFLDPDRSTEGEYGEKTGVYRIILEKLREEGACFAGLSGSGSCCFGIFRTVEAAKKAEEVLIRTETTVFREFMPRYTPEGPSKTGFFVRVTFFLAQNSNAVLQY